MSSGATMRPFKLVNRYRDPIRRLLFASTRPACERMLALPQLNNLYEQTQAGEDTGDFCERALSVLGVRYEVCPNQIDKIPPTGPLIIVANHPFGGLEGLVMLSILRRVRQDSKLLANYMLSLIPDLADAFLFVDPFGGPDATARNAPVLRQAIEWVSGGGVLGTFPAGEVSHLHLSRRRVIDPRWDDTIARLVEHTRATVMTMLFSGRNSDLFQVLGLVHPRIRTVLLPREMLKKRDGVVNVEIGNPIAFERLDQFANATQMTAYMRLRTYILRGRVPCHKQTARRAQHGATIVAPRPPDRMLQEVEALPGQQQLVANGTTNVYFASAKQIPQILREIGRLRELTFRAVGEGTAREIDLDRFDDWYVHLFAWDHEQLQVIGAYRMGLTDRILPRFGQAGLYTTTLFHYKTTLLKQINPAIELGRSFVHPNFQKTYAPLLLLWRGIGAYLTLKQRYRNLFGPVCISRNYESISKQLLMSFLHHNRYLPNLARLLRPRHPPHIRAYEEWNPKETSTGLRDVDDINELIRDIESDGKSIPVLLRQYLKLNAVLLGFNVDPAFGDAIDGLMLVDLCKVDRAILIRYMGDTEAGVYLAHHGHPT